MSKGKKISKKSKIDLSTILGLAGAFIGSIVTVWSLVVTEDKSFLTVLVLSLVLEVGILGMWTLCIIEHYRHKKAEEQLLKDKQKLVEECNELKNKANLNKKELDSKVDKVISRLSEISLSIKNNSIHNNEWLVKVPSEGDESYKYSNLVANNSDLKEQDKRDLLIKDAKKYASKLFDLYKKYCSDMLEEVKRLETAYIKIKGCDIRIAVSLKLFDKPYIYNVDRRTDIHVYTAYRDKDTYNDKNDQGLPKREIGQALYSIDLNDDFTACLTKEGYFKNNVKRGTEDYRNEHTDFDSFYNCTIVVPIRIKMTDGNRKFFGYLCCDCLNQDSNFEVFDRGATQYLFAFAQNFATFIETIDANWLDRFSDNIVEDIPKTAIELIYKNTVSEA